MQGQSEYTQFKYTRFGPVLAQSLYISKAASIAHFAFYHVDLNAGGGFNHEAGVPGSPQNFLAAVKRTGRENFFAFFVDNDPRCVRELIVRPEVVEQSQRVHIFQRDNAEVLPGVSEFVARRERSPHLAVGSIIIDPNGYHKAVPWLALREFCAAHPRFDVFINLNVRSYRMEKGYIQDGDGKWATYDDIHPPSTFETWFSRRHWMWTDICQIKGNSWIQGVGRSMATARPVIHPWGFMPVNPNEGERFSLRSNLREPAVSFHFYQTYDEYLAHPMFRAVRAVALRRDGYRCACGQHATEVHHLRYPPWGTFDVPSDLISVCHACHCELEGKAR